MNTPDGDSSEVLISDEVFRPWAPDEAVHDTVVLTGASDHAAAASALIRAGTRFCFVDGAGVEHASFDLLRQNGEPGMTPS